MPEDWLSIGEAAERLGVGPRRVRRYVDDGTLRSQTISGVHLVSRASLEHLLRTRPLGPGAPLSAEGAWRRIAAAASPGGAPRSRKELDLFRRAVRTRAQHMRAYVHPALLSTAASAHGALLGGRAAAEVAGAAVDGDDSFVELYVSSTAARNLQENVRPRVVDDPGEPANLLLHIVPDDAWPFSPSASVVPAWVAWLDLADGDDRAADTLLDLLLGGRLVG